jgi:hypothetical protein
VTVTITVPRVDPRVDSRAVGSRADVGMDAPKGQTYRGGEGTSSQEQSKQIIMPPIMIVEFFHEPNKAA